MFRKILASFIAVSLMLGSLSGCKKGGETEPTEVTVSTTDIASNAETETENNTPVQTGIVDMTDPTRIGDYGKIYYAPVDEKHIAEEDSVKFVDNEILVVAKDGVSEEDVRSVAGKYRCEIVGEIEVTGDYQLRLSEVKTKAELENTVKSIEAEAVIDSASLNLVIEESDAKVEEHAGFRYGNEWSDDLQDYSDVKGKSWGIEAIKTMEAWDELNNHSDRVNPVRVGLADSGFDIAHEDLGFAEVFYDHGKNGVSVDEGARDHGTHVAGTMAAKCIDNTGICGVYPYGDGNLYGSSALGAETKNVPVMIIKVTFAELIVRNVKVINYSQAYDWYRYDDFKDWYDKYDTDDHYKGFDEAADYMGDFFDRMISLGYDFVIVTGAGNNSKSIPGKFDSHFSSIPNHISREKYPRVYDRIIVVGAIDINNNVADYSDGARIVNGEVVNRVDVLAPGGDQNTPIYSTLPGSTYGDTCNGEPMDGTSMAAPHVSGVAAMVWSANNSLSGAEVKQIITETRNDDLLVNAQKAVKKAFETNGTGNAANPEYGSVQAYVVDKSDESKVIANATVTMTNVDTGEKFDAVTDEKYGHFEIALPEGRYSLSVQADGYMDYVWPDGKNYQNPIVVEKEQINYLVEDSVGANADGKIRMTPLTDNMVRLAFIAQDAKSGKPFANQEVTIRILDPELSCAQTARYTDSDGKVSFYVTIKGGGATVDSKVTLRVEGYKDYVIDSYSFSTKQTGVNPEQTVLFEKREIETEPGESSTPEDDLSDGLAISEANFPDEHFRRAVQKEYDEDGDGVFSKEELEKIRSLHMDREDISSLQGIELFKNLKNLWCSDNNLTSLDMSHNPKLEYLSCENNPLSDLDVTHNPALEDLYCGGTGLKEIDVSHNSNLKKLYCGRNELTSLDVSHNPVLEELVCTKNELTSLDVSHNPKLVDLEFRDNQLTSLDLSKNTELEKLYCSSNLLTKLDVSHNPKLKQLHCQVNELQTLDVSHNPLLESIECFDDQLTELDVSHNPVLQYLDCGRNQLKSLDVSHNPALIHLCCGGNQLTSLDVSRNEELKMLQCAANQISNLDLSNNKQLTDLRIDKKTSYTGLIPNVDIELIDRSNGYNVTRIKSE